MKIIVSIAIILQILQCDICSAELELFSEGSHIPAGLYPLERTVNGKRETIQIYLDEYYIDTFEVSVSDYAACVKAGKCSAEPFNRFLAESEISGYSGSYEDAIKKAEQDKEPMRYVTFPESAEFCAFFGKRLPTQVEWENASRGSEKFKTQLLLSVNDTSHAPSIFGVYNMLGNIRERTLDSYHSLFRSLLPQRNPLCTGDFFNKHPNYKEAFINMRIASGFMVFDNVYRSDTGFRCVRSKIMNKEDFNN